MSIERFGSTAMSKSEQSDCSLDHGGVGAKLEKYFGDITVECPYGLAHRAVYHQAQFGSINEASLNYFLQKGFRRNGNYLYTMHCQSCRGCVPIRLRADLFQSSRGQRRVQNKNSDISVNIAPLSMEKENLQLLNKFLASRFPRSRGNAINYYSGFFLGNLCRSFEIRYRLGERLLGVSIVDFSTSWVNAVYFYFDPDEEHRSPGTFNILTLIDFCRKYGIEYLYLGYWIEKVSAMNYKTKFRPYELLVDDSWREFSR